MRAPPSAAASAPRPAAPVSTSMIMIWYLAASAGSAPARIWPVIMPGRRDDAGHAHLIDERRHGRAHGAAQHVGEGLEPRRPQCQPRLDRRPLALRPFGQGLQGEAHAGERAAEHHAEDRQHVARRVPGLGSDHEDDRIERGEPACQQQRRVAEPVAPPPPCKAPLLALRHLPARHQPPSPQRSPASTAARTARTRTSARGRQRRAARPCARRQRRGSSRAAARTPARWRR